MSISGPPPGARKLARPSRAIFSPGIRRRTHRSAALSRPEKRDMATGELGGTLMTGGGVGRPVKVKSRGMIKFEGHGPGLSELRFDAIEASVGDRNVNKT